MTKRRPKRRPAGPGAPGEPPAQPHVWGRPDPKQLTRLWEGTAGGPLPRPSLAKGRQMPRTGSHSTAKALKGDPRPGEAGWNLRLEPDWVNAF